MSVSKRKQGERLNKAGRLSPLEVMQERMEHFEQLAKAEKAKGEDASMEKIGEYLAEAQNAAEALAPYRHPRLQATTTDLTVQSVVKVIQSPELCDSNEDWIQRYVPKDLRDKSPTEIDGTVVASSTAAAAPPTPQPASNAVELYNPDNFRLEVIGNRYFSLKSINDPSRP
jgi:hypothetical protein